MKLVKDKKIILLEKIKSFFVDDKKNYKLFFPTYWKGVGYFFIHFFSETKISFHNSLKIIFSDILGSSYLNDMRIVNDNEVPYYDKIIVSWAFKKNFSKKGIFSDEVLNTKSNQIKNSLWFLIYSSEELPKKIEKNCILLAPFKDKKFNFFFLLKNILKNFFKKYNSVVFNLQLFSSYSIFANESEKFFNSYLKKDLKLIFMPYEAQPFQNKFFLNAKKISNKINTIGYVHSPPEAFPVQSLIKNGYPEKLILNGKDQKYCYKKFLGWKNKKIYILPSLRFRKRLQEKISNKIFLPYSILNQEEVIESINFIYKKRIANIKKFRIQAHPLTSNTDTIKKFIQKIKHLNKIDGNFKQNKNLSIFIGASGAAGECLERGIQAIHISDNPITDIYSKVLYPSLEVTKIKEGIFLYKLKKKGNLLMLGNNKINLNYYLKKL